MITIGLRPMVEPRSGSGRGRSPVITGLRPMGVTRRALLVGMLAGACTPAPFARPEARGLRVGFAALDTGSGAHLEHRPDERFAMCSTFKWLLAAVALSRLDAERSFSFSQADLLEHSPVTSAHVGGSMSVAALCDAAVEESDNTAANLLLQAIGGPPTMTAFARSVGDDVTRFDRLEPALNTNTPGDPRDTTTPRAMLSTMRRVLLGDAIAPAVRERVMGAMLRCKTGAGRLRAGFPPDWVLAHKTGTGDRGACNDLGIATPPGGRPILVAAFLSDGDLAIEAEEAVHRDLAREVARAFRRG